jgi:four helix bundle protein
MLKKLPGQFARGYGRTSNMYTSFTSESRQKAAAPALLVIADMQVRKHTDLIAWQLCHQLRALVLKYTRSGPAAREYDWRRQLRKSARSACYLTSEGFYRYGHGEFGHFLNLAHGSLGEALDQIDEGRDNQYFSDSQHTEMKRICLRALKANVALRKSWGDKPAPEFDNTPSQP